LGDWTTDLPDEGLVDVRGGSAVRWLEGQGWVKEAARRWIEAPSFSSNAIQTVGHGQRACGLASQGAILFLGLNGR